jgi:hypothetical protein
MSIPEHVGEGKRRGGRIPSDLLVILILVLCCSAAFGLGILTGKEMGQGGEDKKLWIEELSKEGRVLPAAAAVSTEVAAPTTGTYVASKSGTKYHLPDCSGAKRIKEENKVWFETKEQAAAAGYTPASNCPGI